MKKPNIVFVLTDQWRAQAFGHRGDPNVRTPNIDALAARSLNFENAVSVCPVCTPQRAALLTGRLPTSTGMFLNDLYLPAEELCMAEIMLAWTAMLRVSVAIVSFMVVSRMSIAAIVDACAYTRVNRLV